MRGSVLLIAATLCIPAVSVAQAPSSRPSSRPAEVKPEPGAKNPGSTDPGSTEPGSTEMGGVEMGGTETSGGSVDFVRDVLPILEISCFECHQAKHVDARGRLRKPKGGLRLDGKDWILRGGDSGASLVAGEPDESELYVRLILDADDDDLMPGGDADPLPEEDQETIRTWIAEGASFGAWVGVTGDLQASRGPAKQNARLAHFEALSESVRPVAEGTIKKVVEATGGKARIVPLGAGSPLLRVEWFAHQTEVTDDDVAVLAKLEDHIAVLSLARSKVTDRGLKVLADMRRLAELDLRETGISNAALEHLAGLESLRSLNLVATKVDDRGATRLAAMKSLRDLYLWRSGVSSRAVKSLQMQLKDATVRGAPSFDVPMPAPAAEGPRRRRR
jgi:hypothetical protein